MTHKISKIWIIIGLFWFGAILLNYWNVDQMNQIVETRQRIAVSKMIKQYTMQNTAVISDIMTTGEILIQPVSSPKMGAFTAEQEIKKLAEICSLRNITSNTRYTEGVNEKIPINFQVRGTLQNTLKWIDTLQDTYPYIQATNIKISVLKNSPFVETRISVYYKFKQREPGKSEIF